MGSLGKKIEIGTIFLLIRLQKVKLIFSSLKKIVIDFLLLT